MWVVSQNLYIGTKKHKVAKYTAFEKLNFDLRGVLWSEHFTFYAEVIEEKDRKNMLLKGLNIFKVKQLP